MQFSYNKNKCCEKGNIEISYDILYKLTIKVFIIYAKFKYLINRIKNLLTTKENYLQKSKERNLYL